MSNENKNKNEKNIKKVGICGYGFVGGAIYDFFMNRIPEDGYIISVYDKYKHINTFKVLLDTDLIFICLPTNYDDNLKTYDMKEISSTVNMLNENNYKGLVVIKSTVLPNYCEDINSLYSDLKIFNNPEFLSARTAKEDFATQKYIILGYTSMTKKDINYLLDFYSELFPKADISVATSKETALMKLGCNSFYATKIQYFTELYLLCRELDCDYDVVKNMMLGNQWINPMHTMVPGTDEKISYGGMCFPKDIAALSEYMKELGVSNLVVDATIKDNKLTRDL
jgi:UDPglucose 6-dehydrogenase